MPLKQRGEEGVFSCCGQKDGTGWGKNGNPLERPQRQVFFFKQSIMIDAINSNFISVGLSYEKILESVIKCLRTF